MLSFVFSYCCMRLAALVLIIYLSQEKNFRHHDGAERRQRKDKSKIITQENRTIVTGNY